jgi:glutathione S-transferase
MKLYTYWRSTSSYRVRIALALKKLEAEQAYVPLPYWRGVRSQKRTHACCRLSET